MAQRRVLFLLVASALAWTAPAARAQIDASGDLGVALERIAPTSFATADIGKVLWFAGPNRDTQDEEAARIASLGFDVTVTSDPVDLRAAGLAPYSVLWIGATGPGVLADAQQDVEAWVRSGHGLLVHQPNATGALDYMPAGCDVLIESVWWCGVEGGVAPYTPTIVDVSHPVTTGLLDDDLSGNFDEIGSVGPAFVVLAENLACDRPSLLVATPDDGRVAVEDGNTSSVSARPGSDLYWIQLLTWLGAGTIGSTTTTTSTIVTTTQTPTTHATTTTTHATTTSSTTTTTVPGGCSPEATFDAVVCLIDALADAVGEANLARLGPGLANAVAKAQRQAAKAAEAGGGKVARTQLKKVVTSLVSFEHKLDSRNAQRLIAQGVRTALSELSAEIRDRIAALRETLHTRR